MIGEMPSGSGRMFALSRPRKLGEPPVRAPACDWPSTASFSPPGGNGRPAGGGARLPKFDACMFQFSSVKPRLYDQSCMRLCIAKRSTEAEMLLPTFGTSSAGLQPLSDQAFVNGNE